MKDKSSSSEHAIDEVANKVINDEYDRIKALGMTKEQVDFLTEIVGKACEAVENEHGNQDLAKQIKHEALKENVINELSSTYSLDREFAIKLANDHLDAALKEGRKTPKGIADLIYGWHEETK